MALDVAIVQWTDLTLPITIVQWADFTLPITLRNPSVGGVQGTPIDLTGYTAVGVVFKGYASAERVLFSFAFAIDRTSGNLTANLTANQAGALPYGLYLYEIKLSDPFGKIVRILKGQVNVDPGSPLTFTITTSGALPTLLPVLSGSLSSVAPIVTISGSLPTLLPALSGSLIQFPLVSISGALPTLLPVLSGSINQASSGTTYDFSQPQNAYLIGI